MKAQNVFVGVLCSLSLVAAFYFAQTVVMTVILSVLLFFLLDPISGWMEARKIPRSLNAPALIVIFLALSGVVGRLSYAEFAKLANEAPQYRQKITQAFKSFQGKANEFQQSTSNLMPKNDSSGSAASPGQNIQKVEVVEKFGSGWGGAVLQGLDSVMGVAMDFCFILILTLFFLLEKNYLKPQLRQAMKSVLPMDPVGAEIGLMTKGFFVGNLIVGLATAVGFFVVFSIVGLENTIPLALASGFINLIPLVGAVLGALFPLAQAFLQFDRASPFLVILGSSVFLHFFVANVIIPKLVGRKINVNASASTISLIFWGWLWGAVGLILAIPLTAIIRIALANHPQTRAWANLIAEKPEGSVAKIPLRPRRKSV